VLLLPVLLLVFFIVLVEVVFVVSVFFLSSSSSLVVLVLILVVGRFEPRGDKLLTTRLAPHSGQLTMSPSSIELVDSRSAASHAGQVAISRSSYGPSPDPPWAVQGSKRSRIITACARDGATAGNASNALKYGPVAEWTDKPVVAKTVIIADDTAYA
jgi:hypothetical protein